MNKLHVYTGGGKGKTTAAMGLALRSLGHGNTVLVAQFMKDHRSGELLALRQFPSALVMLGQPVQGFVSAMSEEEKQQTVSAQEEYLRLLLDTLQSARPQTIILDELGIAAALEIISEEAALRLIQASLAHGETVVTGAFCPAWLTEMADYITCMQSQRHPYETQGLAARQSVEW